MIYLITIAFTVGFSFYTKWQFIDDRGGAEGKWHKFGAAMRAIPLAAYFFPTTWQNVLLAGVVNLILWDILVNIIALDQKWWYVGRTAAWDKFLNEKRKWIFYAVLLAASIYIKIKL